MRRRLARGAAIRSAMALGCASLWLAVSHPALALNPPDDEASAVEGPEAVASYEGAERAAVRDPHDPKRAMHPVRVVAYALHPVGVALDWILVRPAVWVVRQEPFRTVFGYED